MNIIWTSFQMLVNIFESAVFCYFISKHFPGRFSKSTNYLINFLAVIFMSGVYAVYYFYPPPWWLDLFGMLLYWILFACIFKKGFWYEKNFWTIFMLTANMMCAVAAVTITMFISGVSQYTIVFVQGVPRILFIFCAKTAQVIVIYYLSRLYTKTFKLEKNTYLVLTSVPFLSVVIALSIIQTGSVMGEDLYLLAYLAVSGICLVAILMIAYYLYYKVSRQSEQLIKVQSELQYKTLMAHHDNELVRIEANMRTWRHDFHNHLQSLLVLSHNNDKTGFENFVSELGHELLAVDEVCNTGNKAIDAILAVKCAIAKSDDIVVSLDIKPIAPLPIGEVDTTRLFGNLMDNAIEANRKAAPKERFINLSLGMIGEMIHTQIANATNNGGSTEGGKFVTTKEDKHFHGLGLLSADRIADSVNGHITRKHENNVFTTTVLLPKG